MYHQINDLIVVKRGLFLFHYILWHWTTIQLLVQNSILLKPAYQLDVEQKTIKNMPVLKGSKWPQQKATLGLPNRHM